MIRKAVILCGGLATRFLPYSKAVPKEMLPIVDKPIIHYLIEDLSKNGIKDILIITNRNKDCMENYFDKNTDMEERLTLSNKPELLNKIKDIPSMANVYFIRQVEPKGTGHALMKAKSFIGNEPFYICFGDELFYNKDNSLLNQMLKAYEQNNAPNLIACKRVPIKEVYKYGMARIEGDKSTLFANPSTKPVMHKVLEFVEKPKIEEAPSNLSYLGPAILSPEIFDILPNVKPNGLETLLPDAFPYLYNADKLYALEVAGERLDIGNPLGFVKANLFFALQDDDYKADLLNYINSLK